MYLITKQNKNWLILIINIYKKIFFVSNSNKITCYVLDSNILYQNN